MDTNNNDLSHANGTVEDGQNPVGMVTMTTTLDSLVSQITSESPAKTDSTHGELISISNADFVEAVCKDLPDGASVAVCTKSGDPTTGGWVAMQAALDMSRLTAERNNYLNCSVFMPSEEGAFSVKKTQFAGCMFLLLDDLGTKIPLVRLKKFKLSWMIETSPGNYQGGIMLAAPITDGAVATQLLSAIIAAGLCDAGSTGPLSRWARLPVAINGKPKYANEDGAAFRCRLVEWRPDMRYTPEQIVDGLNLELNPVLQVKQEASTEVSHNTVSYDNDVWVPRSDENPVVTALKEKGLYKTPLGSGKHDVTCPWVHEHTDMLDTGAAYFEPSDQHPLGGYCCQHSHRGTYHIRELLDSLGVAISAARNQSVIRIIAGELHRVVDAGERVLADRGQHYQSGGLIVSVVSDPTTGDPAIVPTSSQALTRELSMAASWEKFDGRAQDWVPCDPPSRHVGILYDLQDYQHLAPLAGVVRQPYFRETDGELITTAGYDAISHRYGVFDARQFVIPEPTLEAAREALALLEDLLVEFHFVSATDKSAALSALLTAVVRPTLDYAPAYHVRAPIFSSGKTYLCELIGAFAGPGINAKVSYPTTSEEATKVILSLLLASPALIEFDDMDTDWTPHGTIKRMLTADKITDRILGVSKTATVSTRTMFLGSGNNVGPVRDLLRRVLTIHVDPRCPTPATITYKGNPVDKVRNNRAVYVSAVLTIILAWRKAGSPRSGMETIATYSGAWTDYCRQPLMWLGHPDPATSLLEQVKHDPDADALGGLMQAWWAIFGSTATTVRKAVDKAVEKAIDPNAANTELLDAMREYPIEERGEINRSKLGWLLKKNANRIVGGYAFEQSPADGRVAWRVVPAKTPGSPPSPPSSSQEAKTPAENSGEDGDTGNF